MLLRTIPSDPKIGFDDDGNEWERNGDEWRETNVSIMDARFLNVSEVEAREMNNTEAACYALYNLLDYAACDTTSSDKSTAYLIAIDRIRAALVRELLRPIHDSL